jgi:hypothetical protein
VVGVGEAVPEPVAAAIEGIPVDIAPSAAAAMTEAGEGWLSPGTAVRAARTVVAAWVAAVDGDDRALRELAERAPSDADEDADADEDDGYDAAYGLLHPARKSWVIAPHPVVAGIELRRPGLGDEVRELSVEWRFTAGQRYGGPVIPPGWMGPGDREYVGTAYLAPDESRAFPWRMSSGHVETVDEYYGYAYAAADEMPEEYQGRTGLAVSAAALVPSGTYRLLASFAEHDHKFSGDASADVDSDVPLTREEAQRLAQDAAAVEASRRMAAMYPEDGAALEVRPSLSALRVSRLLEQAPPVDPATGTDGAALDDFARRYAASRRLAYPDQREPAWRDPGPWFLATLNITRAHGLMAGGVGGGPAAEVWYAEGARSRGGSRERWIVARYVIMGASRAGGIAVAVRKPRLARPGPPPGLTSVPRGLTEVRAGDGPFRLRYVVGAAGGDPFHGDRSWAGRLLGADFTAWLLDQPYGDHGAEATCFQLQGGLVCVYAAGWPQTADALDAFRERAARIASAVEHATRSVVQ